jgi:hypothetical protein
MAISLSPAVTVQETNLTGYVAAVATTTGAYAGEFSWGPVGHVTQVTNELDLLNFGKPSSNNFPTWYTAYNFLSYADDLLLVRAETNAMRNAVVSGTALKVRNSTDYDNTFTSGGNSVGMFAAKYPGSLGNSLKVSIADANTFTRTLTGTVAVASASNVVTGTSTVFTSEVSVGDYIVVTVSGSAITKQVTAIASATSLTVDSVYSGTATGVTATGNWEFSKLFSGAPIASDTALSMGVTNDGLHMVVVDEDGMFSGVPGSVLEKFENVSKALNAKRFDGTSAYYKTVLNRESAYAWWMDHPNSSDISSSGTAWGSALASAQVIKTLKYNITYSLTGGVDGFGATDGELETAFGIFSDDQSYDISLVMTGKASPTLASWVISNIGEVRKDCVVFVSPVNVSDSSVIVGSASSNIDQIVAFRNALPSSTYAFLDSGYKYQYDKYNDVYRWIPMNGDIAGLCARTDQTNDPWFSPAGLNRGQIKNVVKLATNPSKPQRDTLFQNAVNPVVTFLRDGTVLFGDKMLTGRASAFDQLNVRRLFIVMEKAIATAAKYQLFEQNNDLTAKLFVNMMNPYLRDIQGRQGIEEFLIDVGPTVNTGQVKATKTFAAKIYIRPIGAIRFISLEFIAVRSDVSFTEIQH